MIEPCCFCRKGKWKESEWILCDRYLPYQVLSFTKWRSKRVSVNHKLLQLGGGYVLAHDLVEYLGRNSKLFKIYKNEDVAVGAWLAGIDVKWVVYITYCVISNNFTTIICIFQIRTRSSFRHGVSIAGLLQSISDNAQEDARRDATTLQ